MKCEICKRAEATTAVTVNENGVEKELYVCASCARKARGKDKKHEDAKDGADEDGPKVTVLDENGEAAPPFVDELAKAALAFMQGMVESEISKKKKCPFCKSTWEEIKEKKRLNCPKCWKTFAQEIRADLLGPQWGASHVGSAPRTSATARNADARKTLERELKKAIASEDYRLAAKLKRQLDELQGRNEQ